MRREIELRILHEYLAGYSQKAIANNYSIPKSTIYTILRRYRSNPKYRDKLLAKKRGRPKTIDAQTELKIVNLRNKGCFEREIAEKVGLSRTGVHAVLLRNLSKIDPSKSQSRRIEDNLKRLKTPSKNGLGVMHVRRFDYDLIRRLRGYGESYRAIARTVRSSNGLVWYALKVEEKDKKRKDL